MTRYVEHLRDAWTEFWSGGDDRVGALLYAADATYLDVARGSRVAGRDAVTAERNILHRRAERAGALVRRVVADDGVVVAEFVVAAAGYDGPEAAPGCAWWWLDADGRIEREDWWFDWTRRRPADPAVAGHAVRGADGPADRSAREALVHTLVTAEDGSPTDAVDRLYGPDCIVDLMGDGPDGVIRGRAALLATEAAFAEGARTTTVGDVVGEGAVVAWTQEIVIAGGDGGGRSIPMSRVCTLSDGRIAGEHRYVPGPRAGRRLTDGDRP